MKGLKSIIITTILDETGIRLHPRDFQITTIDHILSLKLWGVELISKKYQSEKSLESNEFAEDLLNELFDEYFDFREKVIEVKKIDLTNQYLELVRTAVVEELKKNKIGDEVIESLDYEFIDVTGAKGSKIADDWGFPVFGLRITDFELVDYFYSIDVQKEPMIVDEKEIAAGLLKQVR